MRRGHDELGSSDAMSTQLRQLAEPILAWMARRQLAQDITLQDLLEMCRKDMWLGEKHIFTNWVETQLGILKGRRFELVPTSAREFDVFISYAQGSGQDQTMMLTRLLKDAGLKVWHDMVASDLTAEGMEKSIANSRNLLIFLSNGVMSRPFCNKEQRWGKAYQCNLIGILETDSRHGAPQPPEKIFKQEKDSAPEDLKHLLDDVEFMPYRRREFELEAMVKEIVRRATKHALPAPPTGSPRTSDCSVGEGKRKR
jgi:hypothetical protein